MTPLLIGLAVVASVVLGRAPSAAQAPRTPLRNLAADQVVREVRHCRDEYRLTMANGDDRRYGELDLRFKTDTSSYGPERGKPVLLPAGMRGDRAQLIFSGPDDLKRFLVERCDEERR